MDVYRADVKDALVVALRRGEDLHTGIVQACLSRGLTDAAVLECHATVDPVVLHHVVSTGFPVEEAVQTLRGPWEVGALGGLLIGGALHAHLTVGSPERSLSGHLHAGTTVLYLAEAVVMPLQFSAPLNRTHDEDGLWCIPSSEAG